MLDGSKTQRPINRQENQSLQEPTNQKETLSLREHTNRNLGVNQPAQEKSTADLIAVAKMVSDQRKQNRGQDISRNQNAIQHNQVTTDALKYIENRVQHLEKTVEENIIQIVDQRVLKLNERVRNLRNPVDSTNEIGESTKTELGKQPNKTTNSFDG